jgi:hypothetical protein
MPADGDPTPVPGDDEDADDCICGMEHLEDEVTSDAELPPASGGIETVEEAQPDNEDDVDGCELDFTTAEQTGDEELPATVGGM